MPGGEKYGEYIILGLLFAAIFFGVAWVGTRMIPFVPSLNWGTTTCWIVCGAGFFAGGLVGQVSNDGWRSTVKAWLVVLALLGVLTAVGAVWRWVIPALGWQGTMDSLLKGLADRLGPAGIIWVVIGLPVSVLLLLCVWAIFKFNLNRRKGQ